LFQLPFSAASPMRLIGKFFNFAYNWAAGPVRAFTEKPQAPVTAFDNNNLIK
jgi:hypothetical protein